MNDNAQPRLAIIGCGAVVQHHLAPALRRIGWLPQVLVDPSRKNLETTAKLVGKRTVQTLAGDWTEAINAFDAAIVAAPHAYHGPLGTALAKAGKHVFMEKPLATSTAECRVIVEAAKQSGTILSVGLLRRYLHATRWTRELLQSGILGQIRHFEAYEGLVFNWAVSTGAMLSQQASGGGVLMDTGVHTLDLILWWLGEMSSVVYRDDSQGGVEADCVLDCELVCGGSGHIELSRSRNLANTCRIEGTQGFVEVHLYQNEVLACSSNVRGFRVGQFGVDAFPMQRFPELFSAELADFRRSIIEGAQKGVSGEDGVHAVSLIERCYTERTFLAAPWNRSAAIATGPSVAPGTRVAVTGATGFIGGRLVERLLDQGAKVRCLVRNIASAARLARLPVEIIRVDFADGPAMNEAVRGCDLVFHCAYDPLSPTQNQEAVRNLVAACLAHQVERLVHLSTYSVYEPFRDGDLTEDAPDGDGSWAYTRTKLGLENEIVGAIRNKGLRATILQPTIVYGPFARRWATTPTAALLYGKLVLPGRGDGICNALYVDDLIDAMLLAAVREEAIGQRFLVSGADTVTWGHFFEQFAQALGTQGPEYRPAEEIPLQSNGFAYRVKLVVSNPQMIIKMAVQSRFIRKLLDTGLHLLPRPIYDAVTQIYFRSPEPPCHQIYLSDRQQLKLYMAKPVVQSEKAQRLLGYQPRIDFAAGMQATVHYLKWAYGDRQHWPQTRAPQRSCPVGLAQPESLADAG